MTASNSKRSKRAPALFHQHCNNVYVAIQVASALLKGKKIIPNNSQTIIQKQDLSFSGNDI